MENEREIFALAQEILIVRPDKTSIIMRSELADDKIILEVAKSFTKFDASDVTVETDLSEEILVWTVDWRHEVSNKENIPEMLPSREDWSKS